MEPSASACSEGTLTVFFYAPTNVKDVTEVVTSRLSTYPGVRLLIAQSVEEAKASALYGSVEIVLLYFMTPPGALREVLAHNPVRWVHCLSAGINQFLVPEIMPDSVLFTNAKGVYSNELADFTMAAVLYFVKQVPRLISNQRSNTWDFFYMHELRGKTMVVLGFGDIGQAVAKRAKLGFRMTVIGLKRTITACPFADEVRSVSELHAVLPRADVLVMALPNTTDSINIINDEELRLMKATALIVNLGRGSQLNEDALLTHLKDGSLGGAALDVCKVEPLPKDSPLWTCPNLLISPHTACFTDNVHHVGVSLFTKLLQEFRLGTIRYNANVVDKIKGY